MPLTDGRDGLICIDLFDHIASVDFLQRDAVCIHDQRCGVITILKCNGKAECLAAFDRCRSVRGKADSGGLKEIHTVAFARGAIACGCGFSEFRADLKHQPRLRRVVGGGCRGAEILQQITGDFQGAAVDFHKIGDVIGGAAEQILRQNAFVGQLGVEGQRQAFIDTENADLSGQCANVQADVGIDQMVLALLRGAAKAANGDCTAQGIAAGGEERNLLTVCGRKVNTATDCGGGVLLHGALVDAAVPSVVVEVPCVCQDGIADGCGIGVCVVRGGNAVPTHHAGGFIRRRDTVDLAAHDPAGQAERCGKI